MLRATRWIDSLDRIRQTLVWAAVSIAIVFMVVLAGVITNTPTFDSKGGSMWVILMTSAGLVGSASRNRTSN